MTSTQRWIQIWPHTPEAKHVVSLKDFTSFMCHLSWKWVGWSQHSSWSVGPGTAMAISAVYKCHLLRRTVSATRKYSNCSLLVGKRGRERETEKTPCVFSSEFAWEIRPSLLWHVKREKVWESGEYVLFKVTVMQILNCVGPEWIQQGGLIGTRQERLTRKKKKKQSSFVVTNNSDSFGQRKKKKKGQMPNLIRSRYLCEYTTLQLHNLMIVQMFLGYPGHP